ncbi:hypothetical protein, partial [Actinocorallia aurantiaca]|uniref:hypothetical protein n=1 Tax=Actinocorallia aurantiaca TaxID=46204 RepID=UPI0031DA851D
AKVGSDPSFCRERIAQYVQRFDVMLNRALRQRNAVIHGVPTVPDVIASIKPFISVLAGTVVNILIKSASTGDDVVDLLEEVRARNRKIVWMVGEGKTLTKAIYG